MCRIITPKLLSISFSNETELYIVQEYHQCVALVCTPVYNQLYAWMVEEELKTMSCF